MWLKNWYHAQHISQTVHLQPLAHSGIDSSDLQGTTGKELLQLDTQMLLDIGIQNPLHRLQLINRRQESAAAESSKAKAPSTHIRVAFNCFIASPSLLQGHIVILSSLVIICICRPNLFCIVGLAADYWQQGG